MVDGDAVSTVGDVLRVADRHLFALVTSQLYRLSEFGGDGAAMTPLLQQRVNRLDLVPT